MTAAADFISVSVFFDVLKPAGKKKTCPYGISEGGNGSSEMGIWHIKRGISYIKGDLCRGPTSEAVNRSLIEVYGYSKRCV